MAIGKLLLALPLLFYVGQVFSHAGPLNELAVQACVTKVKSQACRYEGGHNDVYIGTCQYMGENLMCVRNQPIQKVKGSSESQQVDHKHQDNQFKKP